MNRRTAMLTFGIGALAAAIRAAKAGADPARPAPPPADPASGGYPAEMLIDWVRVF